MSRSGYTDEEDFPGQLAMWRGRVASAIRGKRGQALLRDLLVALDAMPEKRLIATELQADGEFCALGVLGAQRGIDLAKLDPEDPHQVAEAFGIAACMAQEIVYENDEVVIDHMYVDHEVCGPLIEDRWPWHRRIVSCVADDPNAAEKRWQHMRAWVAKHLKDAA